MRPVVVVEGGVSVEGQRAGHGVVVVVVELHEEVVELGVLDHDAHVGFGDGALRRTGDVVCVGCVGGEVGAQLRDQRRVVLAAAEVVLDVEVEAVDEGVAERARRAFA